MTELREITHIVPVGFTPEKLIESVGYLVRQHVAHKVIIVTLKGDENRESVQAALKKLRDGLKAIGIKIQLEEQVVSREDAFKITIDLLKMIEGEAKNGRLVKINIAGGMRHVGIAAYIASLVSRVEVYSDLPESSGGDYMLNGILEIPSIPIKEIPSEQSEILQVLGDGVDSLDDLVKKMKPQFEKGADEYNNERSRLSHHLKKLEEDGFVIKEKRKKTVSIQRSNLGEIYIRGKRIVEMLDK